MENVERTEIRIGRRKANDKRPCANHAEAVKKILDHALHKEQGMIRQHPVMENP